MKKHKRIIVTGFPHCGTTILKSKLGECSNVFEQINESEWPEEHRFREYLNSDKEFYLWKDPIMRHDIFRFGFSRKPVTPFHNDIMIAIIRNPYYAFSSLIRRGIDITREPYHTPDYYIRTAEVFLDAQRNKYPNVYCIRYEDMFDDNYSNLRNIMDSIGLVYTDDLFETRTKIYNVIEGFPLHEEEPPQGIAEYRIWQINKKFSNFNETSKIELPDNIERIFRQSKQVTELGYNNE